MIFRLANWTVMGLAIFYAAEGTGVIERGRYFPTLPRMEARAGDPSAWLGAVQWGFSALVHGTGTASAQYASAPASWGENTWGIASNTNSASSKPGPEIRLGAYAQPAAEALSRPGAVLKQLAGYYGR
jgi:hypothetical protein